MSDEPTAIEMVDAVATALCERDEEKQAQALQACIDAMYAGEPSLDEEGVYKLVYDAVRKLALKHDFAIAKEIAPPRISDVQVAAFLAEVKAMLTPENPETDVRLRVFEDGSYTTHFGAPDFDLDHRGYWGASSVTYRTTQAGLIGIAQELISEALTNFNEAHS